MNIELPTIFFDVDANLAADAGLGLDLETPRRPGTHPVQQRGGVEPLVVDLLRCRWKQPLDDGADDAGLSHPSERLRFSRAARASARPCQKVVCSAIHRSAGSSAA